jgi:hypothetical protein
LYRQSNNLLLHVEWPIKPVLWLFWPAICFKITD